jgi:cytochrome c peroxidase
LWCDDPLVSIVLERVAMRDKANHPPLLFTLLVAVAAACGDDTAPVTPEPDAPVDPGPDAPGLDDFTEAEQALLDEMTPLGAPPADPTNAFADNADAAALGQMLFFDKSFSGALVVGDDGTNGGLGQAGDTGKVSCHSCHAVGSDALDDRRSQPGNVSLGTNFMGRNSLGMVNSSFYKWTNWGGRFDSQWSLPLAVAEGGATMRSTRLEVAHLLFRKYRTEYDAIFPVPLDARLDPASPNAAELPPAGKPGDAAFDGMTDADKLIVNRIYVNFGKALAAYMRTLVSTNSPFDRYRAGDRSAIGDSAKRGLHLFLARCASCHNGPNLADDEFHALAVPQTGPNVPATDNGRHTDVVPLLASPFNVNGVFSDDTTTGKLDGLAQVDAQRGQFRTKSLRNVAESGPFMHAGQLATLEDVVAFYNAGGGEVAGITKDPRMVPLGLDAQAQADLVAFMKTLTGERVPVERLVDTSK